eukprot:GHVU01048549.1.p1 GENE.GHVU01048549.1~~GHVU01048549.1.p1  ORF type:complete len:133 (-),score=2.30 GHVU01048549.1:339-737(-)
MTLPLVMDSPFDLFIHSLIRAFIRCFVPSGIYVSVCLSTPACALDMCVIITGVPTCSRWRSSGGATRSPSEGGSPSYGDVLVAFRQSRGGSSNTNSHRLPVLCVLHCCWYDIPPLLYAVAEMVVETLLGLCA